MALFRAWITGSQGQVARSLSSILGARGICLGREQLQLQSPAGLRSRLEQLWKTTQVGDRPGILFNPAAWTGVDLAETHQEEAFAINAESVRVLAQFARDHGILFVHFSTDYVFPGTGDASWREDQPTAPINTYGASKLAGEEAIQEVFAGQATPRFQILRTSWVFHEVGLNFVNTILRLAGEREVLRVVSDQRGNPTYAPDLARAAILAADSLLSDPSAEKSGIFHVTGSGSTSWYEFAVRIIDAGRELLPQAAEWKVRSIEAINTVEFPTPARRPLNSRLDGGKFTEIFGERLPHWEKALQNCLERKLLERKRNLGASS
jgi:dTDP-4-dehydrorhamnose reductase